MGVGVGVDKEGGGGGVKNWRNSKNRHSTEGVGEARVRETRITLEVGKNRAQRVGTLSGYGPD